MPKLLRRLTDWVLVIMAMTAALIVAGLMSWVAGQWMTHDRAPRAEIISFLGAFFGAAVTVVGAYLLSEWANQHKLREANQQLLRVADQLMEAAEKLRGMTLSSTFETDDEAAALGSRTADCCLILSESIVLLDHAIGSNTGLSLEALARLSRVKRLLEAAKPDLDGAYIKLKQARTKGDYYAAILLHSPNVSEIGHHLYVLRSLLRT